MSNLKFDAASEKRIKKWIWTILGDDLSPFTKSILSANNLTDDILLQTITQENTNPKIVFIPEDINIALA